MIEPDPAITAEVVRLWRANKTIAEIARATGLGSDSVYRLVVLTGEMRRSISLDPRAPKFPED